VLFQLALYCLKHKCYDSDFIQFLKLEMTLLREDRVLMNLTI